MPSSDLEYLRYGSKGGRPALSISKMKASYYLDVELKQMVPDQMWIKEECKYDIAVIAVRTYMRILSVVRIEVFSLYGYDYMKTVVLCRADLNEYIIAERDFKYLYLRDFEDLYLLNLQGHLNHLPPQDNKILSTAVNLWIRNLDATGFEFKHEFTVIDSPRVVTFRDKYGVQMFMRFNEIHKFSDGTLQQIDEALGYRVKEFKVNKMNLGIPTVAATYNTSSTPLMLANMIQKSVSMPVRSVERAITTDASLVEAHDSDNILKTQSTAMPNVDIPQGMDTGGSPKRQETIGGAFAQTRSERVLEKPNEPPLPEGHTSGSREGSMEHTFELMDIVPPTPHDSPLLKGNTPGSDEGSIELIQELMKTCTSLTKRVLALEEAKTAQDRVITRLKLRVKRLEKKRKARTPQPMKKRLFKGRVETSSNKSLGEDASKQGRNDDKIEELKLTDGTDIEVIMEDKCSGEKGGSTADQVSTARPEVSAASVPMNVSIATPSTPPTTTTIFGDEDLTIAQTLVK
ncbi:hypothetical protein Tco_0111611, partial [Tanacetum coccineum]